MIGLRESGVMMAAILAGLIVSTPPPGHVLHIAAHAECVEDYATNPPSCAAWVEIPAGDITIPPVCEVASPTPGPCLKWKSDDRVWISTKGASNSPPASWAGALPKVSPPILTGRQ